MACQRETGMALFKKTRSTKYYIIMICSDGVGRYMRNNAMDDLKYRLAYETLGDAVRAAEQCIEYGVPAYLEAKTE